jgi:hypothetical protein
VRTRLTIEAPVLNLELVAKQLQLKGFVTEGIWCFEMPARLEGKSINSHLQYWYNLLAKKSEGRKLLQHGGYVFSLHVSVGKQSVMRLDCEMLDLLVRQHLHIVFECE